MATYLVTYDIHNPSNNLELVRQKIKESASDWAGLTPSSYAITTELSASAFFNLIEPELQPGDALYVITAKRPFAGQGVGSVNKWVDKNLTA